MNVYHGNDQFLLLLAAGLLLVALWSIRRGLAPVGVVLQALLSVALAVAAVCGALVLVVVVTVWR